MVPKILVSGTCTANPWSAHGVGAAPIPQQRILCSTNARSGGEILSRHDWKDTALWRALDGRGDAATTTAAYVATWLADVQMLLSKAATAPLDFTLHDDEHAFRVAERMVELIPQDTLGSLSDFEIGLLLLAAYLHDIGMNPSRDIVLKIRDYLLSGDSETDLEQETMLLQRWLDEAHPGLQAPIRPDDATPKRVSDVEFLTSYYCRHRHNDWSENYIRGESNRNGTPPYSTWLEDLVLLCKSHHYNFDELMRPEFDLRIAGSSKIVNLRYLAAILRLADVLEFDPERTPLVVFRHRSVSKKSAIYWHKDHGISLAVDESGSDIVISARTKDAWTHKAVLDTAEYVDIELGNCAQIDRAGAFARGVKPGSIDHYRWPWPPKTTKDIKPIAHTFEYIEGAFRPHMSRIISLLGGTELYRSPLAAIRELLQNAFDAVIEQMARQLLVADSADLDGHRASLGGLNRVRLGLEHVDGDTWLICSDTGAGMTRRIIEQFLLVSGSSPRPEVLELIRQCAQRGIEFARSGQFGVGTLSYFMLADKMIIETRPSIEAHVNPENHGWSFETEGLEAFGELRSSPVKSHGTTVKLRLKDDVLQDCTAESIRSYVLDNILRSPCRIEFDSSLGGGVIPQGWVGTDGDVKDKIVSSTNFAPPYTDRGSLKSSKRMEMESELAAKDHHLREKLAGSLRFGPVLEGDIPGGRGHYRIKIPYFELGSGQAATIFLDIEGDTIRSFPNGRAGLRLGGFEYNSWRGFSTKLETERRVPRLLSRRIGESIVDLDITSGASVSLNRLGLQVGDPSGLHRFVLERVAEARSQLFAELPQSSFIDLSSAWLRASRQSGVERPRFWAFATELREGSPTAYCWREVKFPALYSSHVVTDYRRQIDNEVLEKAGIASELRPFEITGGSSSVRLTPLADCQPDRIILHFDPWMAELGLVFSDSRRERGEILDANFPAEWGDVLSASADFIHVFNKNHKIMRLINEESVVKFNKSDIQSNIEEWGNYVRRESVDMIATFVIANIAQSGDYWSALKDNFPDEYKLMFEKIGLTSKDAIIHWNSGYDGGVNIISIDGCNYRNGMLIREGAGSILPIPSQSKFILVSPRQRERLTTGVAG